MQPSTAAASVSIVVALWGCGTSPAGTPASKEVVASSVPAPAAPPANSASPAASSTASPTAAAAASSAPTATPTLLPGSQFGFIGVLDPNQVDPTGPGAKAKVTVGKAQLQVTDYVPTDVVTRIVRSSEGRFRNCYGAGLANNPSLQGKVSVKLTITTSGAVGGVSTAGSSLADSAVVACMAKAFGDISFPRPDKDVPVSITVDLAP